MSTHKILQLISQELSLKETGVRNTISLLEEGATVPFISRYRKERTGSLDEVQISDIQKLLKHFKDLEARKETILAAIKEQNKLTDELSHRIKNTFNSNELEDIYLPYKRKRKTRQVRLEKTD